PEWADCNHDPSDGCEANLSSPATCTSCDVSCVGPNNLCPPTGCVSACTPPSTLCSDRCVDLTSDARNCGGLIIPRFRGHPKRRENAPGVIHGQEKEKVVRQGVQG